MPTAAEDRLRTLFRRRTPVPVPDPPSDVERRQAAAVVDLALRVAEMGVQCGAVTSEATSFALTICSAYGLVTDVDITAAAALTRLREWLAEQEIDLAVVHADLVKIEAELAEAKARHNGFLAELGLAPLP